MTQTQPQVAIPELVINDGDGRPPHGTWYDGELVFASGDQPNVLTLVLDTAQFTRCDCQWPLLTQILPAVPGVQSVVWTDPSIDANVTCTVTIADPAQREDVAKTLHTVVRAIMHQVTPPSYTSLVAMLPLPILLPQDQLDSVREQLTAVAGVDYVAFTTRESQFRMPTIIEVDSSADNLGAALFAALANPPEPALETVIVVFGDEYVINPDVFIQTAVTAAGLD